MNLITRTLFTLAIVAVPAAFAQKWEIGGGAGGGFYTSTNVTNPLGNATAKFASNIAASAWLGNSGSGAVGGELRYDYQRGDAKLNSSAGSAAFAAQSHAIHYDFLLHLAPKESPVRPFVAGGAGVKIYEGIGKEVAFQPLSPIALLTKTSDLQPLASVGAGVKFNLGRAIGLRAEIHDFLTPFPNKVIVPNANSKAGGWIQDIVVSFGISILF